MKKIIIFYFAILVCFTLFTGCSNNVVSSNSTATEPSLTYESAKELYEEFLSGKITAKGKDGNVVSIDAYLNNADNDYKGEYTIFDLNGDGIPELYIKTAYLCTIFWIKNNQVTVWRDETTYSIPLNNMAILSIRPGGAPKHTTYIYSVLGYNGNDLLKIIFEEYSEGANGEPLKTYFYQGVNVTKEVYEGLTKPLLEINSDKIIWRKLNNKNN